MEKLDNVSVILPSLNPDDKLLCVIDGLLAHGFSHIVLINDGSSPEHLSYFEKAASHPEVQLLHHEENLGKGAALKTAFSWILENRPDCAGIITVDGDNQHHPEDTHTCALRMLESNRIILGVRDFSLPHVPTRSRIGNRLTSMVFKFFVGMILSDTQTGLRAIPREYLPLMCRIAGDRFEYETNMLLSMKTSSIPYEEVKIRTVYIEENKSSHFRVVQDSWRIYKLILAHFFKYTLSSLISAMVDEGLYIGLTACLNDVLSGFLLTAIPVFVARFVSSLLNFYVNQRVVFKSRGSTFKAMLRYFTLAVPLAVTQLLLTYITVTILHIDEGQTLLHGLVYAIVMTLLFFVSFLIQQRWVFTQKKNSSQK